MSTLNSTNRRIWKYNTLIKKIHKWYALKNSTDDSYVTQINWLAKMNQTSPF